MDKLTMGHNMGVPSLFAKFAKEVHGLETIEHPWGFATYEVGSDYVYIVDIYVDSAMRSAKKGTQLMHEVEAAGRALGATKLYGSVAINSAEPLKNYEMLRHLGFEDSHQDADTVYLVREIKSV